MSKVSDRNRAMLDESLKMLQYHNNDITGSTATMCSIRPLLSVDTKCPASVANWVNTVLKPTRKWRRYCPFSSSTLWMKANQYPFSGYHQSAREELLIDRHLILTTHYLAAHRLLDVFCFHRSRSSLSVVCCRHILLSRPIPVFTCIHVQQIVVVFIDWIGEIMLPNVSLLLVCY